MGVEAKAHAMQVGIDFASQIEDKSLAHRRARISLRHAQQPIDDWDRNHGKREQAQAGHVFFR